MCVVFCALTKYLDSVCLRLYISVLYVGSGGCLFNRLLFLITAETNNRSYIYQCTQIYDKQFSFEYKFSGLHYEQCWVGFYVNVMKICAVFENGMLIFLITVFGILIVHHNGGVTYRAI